VFSLLGMAMARRRVSDGSFCRSETSTVASFDDEAHVRCQLHIQIQGGTIALRPGPLDRLRIPCMLSEETLQTPRGHATHERAGAGTSSNERVEHAVKKPWQRCVVGRQEVDKEDSESHKNKYASRRQARHDRPIPLPRAVRRCKKSGAQTYEQTTKKANDDRSESDTNHAAQGSAVKWEQRRERRRWRWWWEQRRERRRWRWWLSR